MRTTPRSASGPSTVALAWAAAACALLAAALFYGPYLVRVDLFSDDVAHHIFWLYRYADPALFPGDISVTYFMTSAPWGYRALYAGLAPLVDVLQASKWLAVLLFGVSALLAWKIGVMLAEKADDRALLGLLAVLAMSLLLAWSRQRDLLAPIAFQRAFALPLLMWTVWALAGRRYEWVGVSWIGAALFYPVMLPVQGLAAGVVFLRDLYHERRMPAYWVLNGIMGVAALGIAAFGMPVPPDIGPAYTYMEAIRMPEFQSGGRLALYRDGLFDWTRNHRTGLGWDREILLVIGAGAGLALLLGRASRIPFAAWAVAGVGLGLWILMRLFPEQLMFGLYLPNRHSRWALGVFGIVALAVSVGALLEHAGRRWFGDRPHATRRIRLGMALAAPLIIVAAMLPNAQRLLDQQVDADLERVYEFIASLPKDTLVAAHPTQADLVPIRARRSVLTSTEISMAWMDGYYREMKPRVEAALRAAYATRIEDFDAALEPYGVDIFLVGPISYKKLNYYKPFDDLVNKLVEEGSRLGFALEDPPAGRVLFRSGDYFVLRVGTCGGDGC